MLVVPLVMPVSFTGFSATALIIMVIVLAVIQAVKHLRNNTSHNNKSL
jgi:heme/copper-type cytochrome/quinol oxidase subunit 4